MMHETHRINWDANSTVRDEATDLCDEAWDEWKVRRPSNISVRYNEYLTRLQVCTKYLNNFISLLHSAARQPLFSLTLSWSIYLCCNRPGNTPPDAWHSISKHSIQPDCDCTENICKSIVQVSPVHLPVIIHPHCEDISSTSAYEIYQSQPKRLQTCVQYSS